MKQYYVYILASRPGGAIRRHDQQPGPSRVRAQERIARRAYGRYSIDQLVYFEVFDTPAAAIQREKNIKHWPRVWKTRLIAQTNASWRDLYNEIAGP